MDGQDTLDDLVLNFPRAVNRFAAHPGNPSSFLKRR